MVADTQLATLNSPPSEIAQHSNGTLAMQALKFRIPGDVINKALADAPDEQRDSLKWFAGYCRARNFGREEMSMLLRKSDGSYYGYDSIYQSLTGRRSDAGVSLEPIAAAIRTFRRLAEERSAQIESGFIETRLSRLMWATFHKARLRKKVSYIFGASQIGKSIAGEEYTRINNHGETIMVEAPSGGGIGHLMTELAIALDIPPQQRQSELRRRLIDAFDDRMLLIVDEAHRFLRSRYGDRGILSLDFIRELYNRKHCGVVLMMTDEGRDLFHKGPHAVALKQLWNRRIAPLQLPSVPPDDDLALFAGAYGLEPAPDEPVEIKTKYLDEHGRERVRKHSDNPLRLQRHMVRAEGLGVWVTILQDASDLAREQGKAITWGAVIKAHCLSQAEAL